MLNSTYFLPLLSYCTNKLIYYFYEIAIFLLFRFFNSIPQSFARISLLLWNDWSTLNQFNPNKVKAKFNGNKIDKKMYLCIVSRWFSGVWTIRRRRRMKLYRFGNVKLPRRVSVYVIWIGMKLIANVIVHIHTQDRGYLTLLK